ncbi:mannitol dehydrogenase family protein [Maricaulis parjimensis]|uniref:mannitol dehydrogenase family protein n=1 Tax=Maricaulis parjimensis TaxID=144023 RepID=UPI00193AB441|nr:mannitol dehydrogenase family protein [Maricaulis parjimensis]
MTLPRLSPDCLDTLDASIRRPAYHRCQEAGIIHLGVGAFHRAHQAVYFDQLMAQGEAGWQIRGASLRSARVAHQLNPQGGLYTMVQRDGPATQLRVIGALTDVLVAPSDPETLIAALAEPSVALVTLTITEKGYHLDPDTGELMLTDAAIKADLERPSRPSTAPGFLVAGLAARRAAGLPPFTVLSCDNIPDNGLRTRAAVLGFARQVNPDLADWIEASVAFPGSMIDRIVPATTAEDIDALEAMTGYRDEAMVKTEPFTQWVVEDNFCHRRPALETVGVQMTDDVAAWERAKLRLLNGSHSALAYLGALAGHTYVHEAIADPVFARFVDRLWDEVEPVLDGPAGFDATAYRAALKSRYANSALNHSLVQIAMDGSQKLPQRLLASLRAQREAGLPMAAILMAVAAWMRWQSGVDEAGETFTVDDPLAAVTAAALEKAGPDPDERAAALLSIEAVFGRDLKNDPVIASALGHDLAALMSRGARACLSDFDV